MPPPKGPLQGLLAAQTKVFLEVLLGPGERKSTLCSWRLAETKWRCQTRKDDRALIAGSATTARPGTMRRPPLIADLAGRGRQEGRDAR
jgi:hypothetical protein